MGLPRSHSPRQRRWYRAGLSFLLSGNWSPMLRWTPAGVINAPVALGADFEVQLLWPALTTAALAAILVWVAVRVFERREL